MSRRLSFLLLSLLPLTIAACDSKPEQSFPTAPKDQRSAPRGKLTGDGGGFSLFGGGDDKAKGGGIIGVNAFLWRATLDTLSFLPLTAADPFGGTVITDWYEDPHAPGERFKVNALILGNELRTDGIKVKLFKQAKGPNGQWADRATSPGLEHDLEDAILTRARQLKVQSRDNK